MYTKMKLLLLLIFIPQVFVFSQTENKKIYIYHPLSYIIFETDKNITIGIRDVYGDSGGDKITQGSYTSYFVNKIPFIDVTWSDNSKEKFLILYNNLTCYLYKYSDKIPYVFGFSSKGFNRSEAVFREPENIKASSFRIESNISYSGDKINGKLEESWVEGVKGQGINEKLFINPPWRCNALHISTGFISFKNPSLYEENSRPKKLKIFVENKFSLIVELDDTPNYQTILFPKTLNSDDNIVMEILDVYKGSKYEDTCINNILYDMQGLNGLLKEGFNTNNIIETKIF